MRSRFQPAWARLYSRVIMLGSRVLPQVVKNAIKRVWNPWPSSATPIQVPDSAPMRGGHDSTTWDVICFSIIDGWQRPQQLMSQLADAGHRVFFLKPAFDAPGDRQYEAVPLRPNVWEIALPPSRQFDPSAGSIPAATEEWLPRMFDRLRREFGIVTAVSIVQLPTWRSAAERARARFGWKIVYDCMADWTSLPGMAPEVTEQEVRLARSADVVAVSTDQRRHEWEALGIETVLVHRAETLLHAIREAHRKVSILVVTWGNLALSRLCLDAVFANTLHPNIEVIVVDNGSTDGTPQMLQELASKHENLHLILNPSNAGFAAANNQALRAATGDVLVLLNNDTVPARGWLPRMLRHLEDPGIGLVVAVTNFSGNESRIAVPYTRLEDMPAFAESYMQANEGTVFDIRVAAMYCVGLRRDAYEVIGPLDEEFTVGMFEDDDYSHRARLAGFRVVCAEDVFVHHFGQASFGKLSKEKYEAIFRSNRAYYEKKWNLAWRPHTAR